MCGGGGGGGKRGGGALANKHKKRIMHGYVGKQRNLVIQTLSPLFG